MLNKLIVGAGISAAVTKLLLGKNSKIIGLLDNQYLNKKKFLRRKSAECNKFFSINSKSFGSLQLKLNKGIFHDRLILNGNSGVWGGNINIENIPEQLINILNKKKCFFKKLSFIETGTISNKKNIYQLQNKNNRIICADDLVKNIRSGYIDNFSVRNKKISIEIIFSSGQKKKIEVKKLYLCIGSLQFIDLLYRSNFLKDGDLIEFSEFKHEFIFRFWNKPFNKEITTVRYRLSRGIGHLLGIQYFSDLLKTLNFIPIFIDQNFYKKKIKYILQIKNGGLIEKKCSLPSYKFGQSAHYCNLKINGVNINNFLKKINKNIKGLGMSFINQKKPGPISNDIILDIKKKTKE